MSSDIADLLEGGYISISDYAYHVTSQRSETISSICTLYEISESEFVMWNSEHFDFGVDTRTSSMAVEKETIVRVGIQTKK